MLLLVCLSTVCLWDLTAPVDGYGTTIQPHGMIGNGSILSSDAIITESMFSNQSVVYMKADTNIVLNPTSLSISPGARLNFYRIDSYNNLNFESMTKTKMCEYKGSKLYRQIVFTYNGTSTELYALVLVKPAGATANFRFEFKNSECKVDVDVTSDPILIFPGYYTSIERYRWIYHNGFNCTYNLLTTSHHHFQIKQLSATNSFSPYTKLQINNMSYTALSSTTVRSSVTLQLISRSPYTRTYGMELQIIGDIFKYSLGPDGAVVVKVDDEKYYLQQLKYTENDYHLLCRQMGYLTVLSNGSRLARRNESMLAIPTNCGTSHSWLSQCSTWDENEIFYRHYHKRSNNITTLRCQGDSRLKQIYNSVRVKIRDEWKEICYDGMDRYTPNVLCKEMGYEYARTYSSAYLYRYSTSKDFIRNIRCRHHNKLKHCDFFFHNYCSLKLNLKCANHPGNLKIVSGYHNKGELQFMDKSICMDSFTQASARVVCKELGYFDVINYEPIELNSTREILHLRCSGTETEIGQCRVNTNDTCTTNRRVKIYCQSLRLSGGPSTNVGKVEMAYKGDRGFVCGYLDIQDAHVICRQVGYFRAYFYENWSTKYGRISGRSIIYRLGCRGSETDINECSWSTSSCSYPAIVTCVDHLNCNSNIDYNINNATFSGNNNYNFMVNIRATVSSDMFWCSGVIIDSQWILTSASCFTLRSNYYYVYTVNGGTYRISRLVIHPNYSTKTGEHNLALIKVANIGSSYNVACLPDNTTETLQWGTDSCVTLGVGTAQTSSGSTQSVLFQNVNLKNDSECVRNTNLRPDQIDNLFCSTAVPNSATGFAGKSGGPVFCRRPDNRDVLVGVTTKAIKANRPFSNEVFTKVNKYVSWINRVVVTN